MERHGGLDGIVCATDSIAVGVMKYLKEKGIEIPGTVAVTGQGDSMLSQVVTPALTTIRYSYEESGRLAAVMLLEMLEKKKGDEGDQTGIFPGGAGVNHGRMTKMIMGNL